MSGWHCGGPCEGEADASIWELCCGAHVLGQLDGHNYPVASSNKSLNPSGVEQLPLA